MFEAKILADSIRRDSNDRITTFFVRYPRFIHAELCRHRLHSRNSASSRAVPTKKSIRKVQENPVIPIEWQKDHKGMQGNEYFEGDDRLDLDSFWDEIKDQIVKYAWDLFNFKNEGVTKQLINRLLEPWMWHEEIITATEWNNFFALRAEEHAEIHFQKIANLMLKKYRESTPQPLDPGDWHIPFGDNIDKERVKEIAEKEYGDYPGIQELITIFISVARCARVSYFNYHGKDDYNLDIDLANKLLGNGHMSPFEHIAQCMSSEEYSAYCVRKPQLIVNQSINQEISENKAKFREMGNGVKILERFGWDKNFRGFKQYRSQVTNEWREEPRI